MSTSAHTLPGADDEVLGWAGRLMQWLRVAMALVITNLMFLFGALAGLVLFGAMPAAVAATAVLRRNDLLLGTAETGLVCTFWRTYRAEFWRANRAGIPFWIAGALLAADLILLPQSAGPLSAALLVFTLALAVGFVLTLATTVTLLSRYDDGTVAVLRYAVVLPAASLPVSAALVVTLAAWAAIVMTLPVLLPLLGAAVPLVVIVRLMDARLDRIEDAG